MIKQFQRLGGALFVPVLLFAFYGLLAAVTVILKNPYFVGSLANPDGNFYKLVFVVSEGGWTIFRNLPFLFAVGLPIGLATKAPARAVMTCFVSYLTFNYFISAILNIWGSDFAVDFSQATGGMSGLTMIAGIKTLDTSIIGAIFSSGIGIFIHNKYYEVKLPDLLGIFQGSTLVSAISFFVMLPLAFLTCLIWPRIQLGIVSLQGILAVSGALGVWLYTFLERILIPTGLHHFIYMPFIFGPAVVEGGIAKFWTEHLAPFSNSTIPLKNLFPQGGFALNGNSKIFGSIGIALALYKTALPGRKKTVLGLVIPAALTAILSGITEPLEFAFLFAAPFLFLIHSVLAATMATLMYLFGVVGNMGGGLVEVLVLNWLPMFKNHSNVMIAQLVIGLTFIPIYYFVFKTCIEKFRLKTLGREDDTEQIKLYSIKEPEKETTENFYSGQAAEFLEALGGSSNINALNNCATRLRISVKDEKLVTRDSKFKQSGALGVVKKGKSVQIIVGLSAPQLRDSMEELLNKPKKT